MDLTVNKDDLCSNCRRKAMGQILGTKPMVNNGSDDLVLNDDPLFNKRSDPMEPPTINWKELAKQL